MSFQNFVEDIMKTGVRNLAFYRESTKLFWIITVTNIRKYLTAVNKDKYLSDIKSSVIFVIPEAEDSISLINYRRIPAYIEFHNPKTKQCVRFFLSTLGTPTVVVGFYSNYEKNGKNNHFSKDAKMVNEMIGPSHITQDDAYVEKMVLFLLGNKDTPYATNIPNKND